MFYSSCSKYLCHLTTHLTTSSSHSSWLWLGRGEGVAGTCGCSWTASLAEPSSTGITIPQRSVRDIWVCFRLIPPLLHPFLGLPAVLPLAAFNLIVPNSHDSLQVSLRPSAYLGRGIRACFDKKRARQLIAAISLDLWLALGVGGGGEGGATAVAGRGQCLHLLMACHTFRTLFIVSFPVAATNVLLG